MYCKKCGKELNDEAVVCVHCGCAIEGKQSVTAQADAPNMGMAVLGFFIPVVGLILYLIWKKDTPLKAKSAGKGALIGFCVSMALSIIYGIIVGFAVSSALGSYSYYY
ncbi:MAG: zinc ribbon domain-containing protein [Clostridia bacterium]|nr:zinc ribbon domain-containing protein [Clostridia bacterium]